MASDSATATAHRPLKPGVYAPIVTIFDANEELDLAAQRKHTLRLARAGLVGLVALGSNGEAVHVNEQERVQIIRAMREELDGNGFAHVPVIAGCSAQSVRGAVELAKAARDAGASYAMVLPPCYYRPAMTPDVLHAFFTGVAAASPLPVLMYNYPGAVAGVDLGSDAMIAIARAAAGNVVGAKFTCANTGKLTRVAAATEAITPARPQGQFLAAGGMADMTIQTAASGGSGIIAGSANVFPALCVRVWDLWVQGQHDEAVKLQQLVAAADGELAKNVVPATKCSLNHYFGYGGAPRRPLPTFQGEQADAVVKGIAQVMELEQKLVK